MKQCLLVTTPEIIDTGSVSFAFMAHTYKTCKMCPNIWGMFRSSKRKEGTINPFALGDPSLDFDVSGTDQVSLYQFEGGKGQVFFCSCDPVDEGVEKMLTDARDAAILVSCSDAPLFERIAKKLGIEVEKYEHPEPISTS